MRFTRRDDVYTSKEACFALKKFIKALITSLDGLVDSDVWDSVLDRGLPSWLLISEAISYRRGHEEKMQMQRRELFLQQQQQSSPLGNALFKKFPINLLKYIASYLAKPSQALFAVSLGNFDISSITAMSTATDTNCFGGGQKRNSDGTLREETSTAVCLADMPAESLRHVVSFIPEFSQASFGLAVTVANDEQLNKNSFAIVDDQCWEDLDFGEIEKEMAMRLTDDDIKAVLWCIGAANKVERLSLAHCVNITGTCLEPLSGSTVIEQIDLSLVGGHESPTLLEPWHPPQQIYFVVAEFEPPLSCEIVLPILDSIIGLKQCSLQHLRFPKSWRTNRQTAMLYRSDTSTEMMLRSRFYGRYISEPDFKPDAAFVSFLSRYNQVLMNRGMISCVKCSHDLPSSGELVGSSISDEREHFFDTSEDVYTFGNQNHTCSQCMQHYCYRCDDQEQFQHSRRGYRHRGYRRRNGYGEFTLERCSKCEKDRCVDCSGMYWCEGCSQYYCMGCKESTASCSDSGCGNKICSDCARRPRQCHKCKQDFCVSCINSCYVCEDIVCHNCEDVRPECQCSNCGFNPDDVFYSCNSCTTSQFGTCQQCNREFCDDHVNDDCDLLLDCPNCKKVFCSNCVTLRQCSNRVESPNGGDYRCSGSHCVDCDCPDESLVDLARTCSELNKEPCDGCRRSSDLWSWCDSCSRMCCKTWQLEKKKLKDDQLNESKKVAG